MRVTMKPGSTMRVARPTDNPAAIAEMYAKGLGFAVLAEFKDHRGFDGVILGQPRQRHHIEFENTKSAKLRPRIIC
jgi:prolyl oligopeptidase